MAELDRRMDQVGTALGPLAGGPREATWYLAAPTAIAEQAVVWMHDRFRHFGLPSTLISGKETDARIGEHARLSVTRKGYLIHPARLARSMGALAASQGIEVHEHTRVQRIDPGPGGMEVVTDTGITCTAGRVVTASGAWVKQVFPDIGGKLWETWMLATEPLPEETLRKLGGTDSMIVGAKPEIMYRRVQSGRLLLGGLDDGTDHPSPTGFIPGNVLPRLLPLIEESLPWLGPVKIDYVWGGPMHVYWDQKPRIQVAPDNPRVVQVAGMSGSGVIWALMAGALAAGLVDPALDTDDDRHLRVALANTKIPPWGLMKAGMRFVWRSVMG
jgi:glycine/D-amino acid oxidase-like deaminating enzyme